MKKLHGKRCPKCQGSGKEIAIIDDGIGIGIEVACSRCQGKKLIKITNACPKCCGNGKVIIEKSGLNFEVKCEKCSGSGVKS